MQWYKVQVLKTNKKLTPTWKYVEIRSFQCLWMWVLIFLAMSKSSTLSSKLYPSPTGKKFDSTGLYCCPWTSCGEENIVMLVAGFLLQPGCIESPRDPGLKSMSGCFHWPTSQQPYSSISNLWNKGRSWPLLAHRTALTISTSKCTGHLDLVVAGSQVQ